jgi:glutaredoxin
MKELAILYRMHNKQHICPFGLRAKDLLERKGYKVEDHKLTTREQTEKFKKKHEVKTTPQVFINDKRVGGYDKLREYFGMQADGKQGTSYTPVITIFIIALLMSIAINFAMNSPFSPLEIVVNFVAFSMIMLATQKLKDIYSFSQSFITYDILAMRHLRYAYVYPFAEAFAGIGMLAGLSGLIVGPVSLFIGAVGAISVFKAVYIDKRELTCACVGGDSSVPLGFVSLTENLFMIAAGAWMLSTI